jgi:hypothetical protein
MTNHDALLNYKRRIEDLELELKTLKQKVETFKLIARASLDSSERNVLQTCCDIAEALEDL